MAIEMIDRRLAKIIRWNFVGLLFSLPLLLSTWSSEVFELPKMLFVYAMIGVICGLWLMRMVIRREILIRRTPLDIPILLFLISQMASTIYSIDSHVSWFGWYGRFHGGLWSTISYTLLYYAFVTNFVDSNKDSPWRTSRRVLNTIIASATIVSIYAILQHFGVDKNFWVQDVVNRVFSTQGQPNWLAGYLVMTIPLVFVITISEIINHKSYSLSLRWNARYMISYFLFMIYALALLWTKSRSGLIGLAVADAVFWLVSLANIRNHKSEIIFKDAVRRFVFIHMLMAGLILATNNPVREYIIQKSQLISTKISSNQIMDKSDKSESEISDISIVGFLADFSRDSDFSGTGLRKSEQGGTESGDIRRLVWTGAVQLVKQRPVFGFGPETFGETYWRVRPKEHNLTSEWNFLYNKAHNEWLNLAANTGLFGLGSHLLLLGWFSVWIIKRTLLGVRQGESLINTAILAALLGVEVVNFFGFSTVTIGTYRYLFMAAAVSAAGNTNKLLKTFPDRQGSSVINIMSKLLKSMSDRAMTSVIQDRDRDENLRKNMDLRQKFILAGLSALILYLISQASIFFLADLAYNRGRAYQDAGYVEEAVEPLMQAVNLAPGEPVFRAELGEALSAAALRYQISDIRYQKEAGEKDNLSEQLKDEAIKNLEIVRRQSPQNLGFVRTEARVLFSLGEEERALQLMKLAIGMAPTNPQLPYSLGQMLSKMGKEEEAAVYYNKAVELKPDYPAIPISE